MALAMFSLVAFYLPARAVPSINKDITRFSPVSQFLSIKFVIFFQFWLVFAVDLLIANDILRPMPNLTVLQQSRLLLNLITCIEMFVACLWHQYCFNSAKFICEETNTKKALLDSFYWLDLYLDVQFLCSLLMGKETSGPSELDHDDEEALLELSANQGQIDPEIAIED